MKNSISESFDPDLGYASKVVLADIEDIVDAIHESFHIYMDDDLSEEEMVVDETEYYEFNEDDVNLLEEVEVEWETPEVTAYYQENEVEVTYQFGIIPETRDGVLKRINRIWTDDDMLKDETNFIFSKEEASTIIAMIASHMDSLGTMDDHN